MSGRKRNWERERKRRREDNGSHSSSNPNTHRHGHHSHSSSSNGRSLEANAEELLLLQGAGGYNRHSHQQQRHYSHNRYNAHHNTNNRQPPSTTNSSISSSSSTTVSEPSAPAPVSSDPAVREIPGFYFDPEKKKYFKITANHVHGSQHPFSQQSIKQKTEQKPVLDPIKKQAKRRFYSTISHYGFLDSLQDRQLGLAGHPRRQLCETHTLVAKNWQKNKQQLQDLPTADEEVLTHFQIDHARQDIYAGSSLGILWVHRNIQSSPDYHRPEWALLMDRGRPQITSLHLTPDDYLISTTLGNMGRSGTLECHRLTESSRNVISLETMYAFCPQKSSIWSSSVAGDKIVVGADQKAIHFQGWKSGRPQVHSLWVGSDIFSTALDPREKQNLVYVGCRNGSIRVFDLNQPNLFSSAVELAKKKRTVSLFSGIGHKESSVHCMKRVSEHYLVTAAMNGEISMWDTRFIASPSTSLLSKSGTFAKPLLNIRESILNYSTKTQFDINHEETLLAAENIEGKLSLWSLRTGDRIRDLDVAGPVNCIGFSKDQGGIWAAVGDQLQHWGIPEHE